MFGRIKNAFKKTFTSVKKTITEKTLSSEEFESIMWELEMELVQSNVAPQVIDLFSEELKDKLVNKSLKKGSFETVVKNSIKNLLEQTVKIEDFIKQVKTREKPVKIMFIGFNGAGKTTTIAKICNLLKKNKLTSVMAACDTFRAASIEQLEQHAKNLDTRLVKHDYGADSAAVAFDAVKHAKARGIDCVLIDTAGRSHENVNLMNELEKINRIVKPDINILIMDSLTGSDSVNQALKFNEAVRIDYIILTKTDSDTKGGTILSVSYVLGKPIIFLGSGQEYDDLKKPDINELLEKIV